MSKIQRRTMLRAMVAAVTGTATTALSGQAAYAAFSPLAGLPIRVDNAAWNYVLRWVPAAADTDHILSGAVSDTAGPKGTCRRPNR